MRQTPSSTPAPVSTVAQALGTLTKHGVKQVDRLLSNRGVDVWSFFAYWTPFIVGARTEMIVALDWTSFAADGQDTIVLSMVTDHWRATPLLCGLQAVLRVDDRVGLRIRDSAAWRHLCDERARRAAAAWVGAGGRARRLVGARVTDAYELPVGVVVCVQDPKMDEPWCLVASEATVPTRVLIRYYGKRWGIEAGFRDIKDMRFGMGLSSMHVRARTGGTACC